MIEQLRKKLTSSRSASGLVEYYVDGHLVLAKKHNIPIYADAKFLGFIPLNAEIYWDKKLVLQVINGSCTINRLHP